MSHPARSIVVMDPVVVSATIQSYEGVRYYRCGSYFQNNGERLHRRVWMDANGPIPDGWHIHHRNHDRSDNRLANLALLPGADHLSHHGSIQTEARQAAQIRNTPAMIAGNARITRDQRSEAAARGWAHSQAKATYICDECGQPFETAAKQGAKFCSGACKTRYRVRSGVDNEQRSCPICGQTFTCNRYARKETCSRTCGGKLKSRRYRTGL